MKRSKPAATDPPESAALRAATRALAARPLTRVALIELLVKRRHATEAAHAAADQLERAGFLSDQAAADAIAQSRASRGDSPALIEQKLREKGADATTARRAAASVTSGRAENATALELARKRVRAAPPSLSVEGLRRRVFAFLARRGYEEDVAAAAVERAVGEVAPR
ncbi:MAG: hypothetical protein ACKVU4_13790 [Phycisphaerales bacterium]